MKLLLNLSVLLLGFGLLVAAPTQPVPMKEIVPMTLEEIAALQSRKEVERLARAKKIPFEIQTNETMRAQGSAAFEQSKSFGAISRLWLTFWLTKGTDTVTVHVSFFFDKSGYVLGRGIIMENNNNP